MLNVVLATKKSKSKIVERFIRSRGIEKFIPIFDSSRLFDTLLTTDSCNLHVFDFMFDLGTINTIRDFRDKISTLNVYVTNVDAAKAYLALTDNVFILPDVYDVFSWFWDSDACKASNVMAFNAMGDEFCRTINPTAEGKTKSLCIEIEIQSVPLKYVTTDGRAMSTDGSQLVLKCKTKNSKFNLRELATREQSEVYNHKQRTLADLPAGALPEQIMSMATSAEQRKQSIDGVFFAEVDKRENTVIEDIAEEQAAPIETTLLEKPAEPAFAANEKQRTSIFGSIKKKPKKDKKVAKRVVSDASYVSFGNFNITSIDADTANAEVNASQIVGQKTIIEERFNSIAEYCVAHGFISSEDCANLATGIESDKYMSKDDKWANTALAEGYISEEQLIQATMSVKNMGVLTWDELREMTPDFSTFSVEKCKKFRFFKLVDETDSDRVTLIYSAALSSLNPELYRMYDNPIPKITLDAYIDRKLKEYE